MYKEDKRKGGTILLSAKLHSKVPSVFTRRLSEFRRSNRIIFIIFTMEYTITILPSISSTGCVRKSTSVK